MLRPIAENQSAIILALIILNLGLGAVLLMFVRRFTRFQARWRQLLVGVSGSDLETLLEDHLEQRTLLAERVTEIEKFVKVLDDKARHSKRHLGVVRFDAFPDVGGEQSFALAVYDDEGNGAVLSSLVGRTDSRVYCKRMERGKSEIELSEEEKRAVQYAAEKTLSPRAAIR
ncbi:MAG: DUF4446 family protein [Armatimonadetes bacterium]|nr:DUF4446 family protein [Armatimonadota bacterium]